MQCGLTTGCALDLRTYDIDCAKRVGERHAHAIGYVTIDSIDDCMDLTFPDPAAYPAHIGDPVLEGTFEQIANGAIIASGVLADRKGGAVPKFRKPRLPRDPLAKRPRRSCPPLAPVPPQM